MTGASGLAEVESGRCRPVVAVVLAGGAGHRFGADRPKQLLQLGDRTVLEHAVGAFAASPEVAEVLVVMAPDWVVEVRQLLRVAGWPDVWVIEGGVLRSDSTRTAIQALGGRDCDILLHDAARPLVDGRIIRDCVRSLDTGEAVTAAIPSTDTIAEITADGTLRAVLEREWLRNVQTPQGFRLATIREAYRLMDLDPAPTLSLTDDCSVVLHYLPDVRVSVVDGSPRNVKVTHPDDLLAAERLLAHP